MFPARENLNKYVLTIRHSTDGFSYVAYNTDKQQFTCFGSDTTSNISLKESITKIEIENDCDIRDFRQTTVIFDNCRNTFVPDEVFQSQIKDKYLEFLGLTDNNHIVCTDFISIADTYNVFAVTKDDFETISAKNIRCHHASSILVASLINDNLERTNEPRIYLSIKDRSFEMTVLKGSNLLFDNNFHFKTKEDFLYFLLFSIEQLHLDASSVPVYFIGMIEEKSKLVELTSRYVRDIRFVKRDNEINLAPELEETPFYFHYILYKSIKCEL